MTYSFAGFNQNLHRRITEILAATQVHILQPRALLSNLLDAKIIDSTIPIQLQPLKLGAFGSNDHQRLVRDFSAPIEIDLFHLH